MSLRNERVRKTLMKEIADIIPPENNNGICVVAQTTFNKKVWKNCIIFLKKGEDVDRSCADQRIFCWNICICAMNGYAVRRALLISSARRSTAVTARFSYVV